MSAGGSEHLNGTNGLPDDCSAAGSGGHFAAAVKGPVRDAKLVCVVGLGYIGLPTAAILAEAGVTVVGVDTDPRVLNAVASGTTTIKEPGLSELLSSVVASGRLTTSPVPVRADAYIIAVPTPLRGLARRHADLAHVEQATAAIARELHRGALVVLESTSPPGTTSGLVRQTLERVSGLSAGTDFLLAHCPERVLPGRIIHELRHNDRVIGGIDAASTEAARLLYTRFTRGEVLTTDATTAELVKLMENTHRDVNIALANEFALVAEHLGVNVWQAIELANHHPRVQILRPGPGVGGHCIAVDPWFVVGAAPQFTPLISAGRAVNESMPRHTADLVSQAVGRLPGSRIVSLGLTYKANVDDTRESPAAGVVELLRQAGAEVIAHDAVIQPVPSVSDLVDGADCILLLVDHTAYPQLDPVGIGARVRRRIVIDTRNCLPRDAWEDAGFRVFRLGDTSSHTSQPEDRRNPSVLRLLGSAG